MPEKILESSARVFQRDLYLYWSYVYHNQPELIGKGLLAKRHLTAVNETLLQRETIGTGQSETDFPAADVPAHDVDPIGPDPG